MKLGCLIACLLVGVWTQGASADDRLDVVGALDVRWVHASGELSYLNGGLGITRFDPEHEDFRLSRAYLAPRLRLTDTLTLHAVIDAYGDHDRNPLDFSEFWLDLRPFPTKPIRWHLRLGAFHMPVSLENRGTGWSDVYSITPSALNAWTGEEFRTIGAEIEARWLGASQGYLGELAIIGAVYGWNDPAGALIADRGFALTDRPSTLFGGLGRPPTTFFHEIDRKPGYYGGLAWRHHDRLEVRALRYDNRADPGASTAAGGGAWRTRFSSFGARLEPSSHWTFIAQYMNGDTAVGSNFDAEGQFLMNYRAAFALASYEAGHERLTVRRDVFGTHQTSGLYGLPSNQTGNAWTASLTHELGMQWQLAFEWIRAWSRFDPRAELGLPPALLQSQIQLALRYRFRFST